MPVPTYSVRVYRPDGRMIFRWHDGSERRARTFYEQMTKAVFSDEASLIELVRSATGNPDERITAWDFKAGRTITSLAVPPRELTTA